MLYNDVRTELVTDRGRNVMMSEELLTLLRQRVASQYYDQPQVVDIIARAILNSRGIYL